MRDLDVDYGGVDDMIKLIYLNEFGVLYNLERRYVLDSIYVSELIYCFFGGFFIVNVIYNGCLNGRKFDDFVEFFCYIIFILFIFVINMRERF